MRVTCWSAVAVAVLFLAGCGQTDRATLHLTAKDNGKSFTVSKGAPFVVTLATNPSTGYHWSGGQESPGGVHVGVRWVSRRYVPPATSRPGARGTEVFRFRSEGPDSGTVGLFISRVRGHNRFDQTVAQSFAVTINVR